MNIIPSRYPQEWASFNSRFRLILSPVITALCFIVVVLGSVYGFQKMLEPQFPGVGLYIALGIAFVVQRLNGVCVHFSTRMIAAAFIKKAERASADHQRFAGVDVTVGILCLGLTVGICTVDFIANREGNHAAVEQFTKRPDEKRVDMSGHQQVMAMAERARDAERAAEDRERQAWYSKVDASLNAEKRRLEARRNHLAPISDRWARVESARIDRTLSGLEKRRQDRHAEFQPKTSDLAGKEKELSDILTRQGTLLQQDQVEVSAINARNFGDYEQRKDARKGGLFLIYLAGMLLWHICHGMKQYRALKFDEKHPDGESALVAIVKTIANGFENALWTVRAKIYDWLPEDEIRDAAKKDLLAQVQAPVCQEVFHFVHAHQGINEMGIYMAMRHHDLDAVRRALRVLKTAKMVFENSGLWSADKNQAQIMGIAPTPSFI